MFQVSDILLIDGTEVVDESYTTLLVNTLSPRVITYSPPPLCLRAEAQTLIAFIVPRPVRRKSYHTKALGPLYILLIKEGYFLLCLHCLETLFRATQNVHEYGRLEGDYIVYRKRRRQSMIFVVEKKRTISADYFMNRSRH